MTSAPQDASPESPRYFFRDALAAAWMECRFEMKFTLLTEDQWSCALDHVWMAPVIVLDNLQRLLMRRPKLYIHPDSLHLLEPQELDILHRTNGYCQTVGVHIGIPKTLAQIAAGGVIIQRNGVAFHWPEQEAA
jgi:hypothetical protein